MPETVRRSLTPRVARMLRELEGPVAASMALEEVMETRLAHRKREPALPPLVMPLTPTARGH